MSPRRRVYLGMSSAAGSIIFRLARRASILPSRMLPMRRTGTPSFRFLSARFEVPYCRASTRSWRGASTHPSGRSGRERGSGTWQAPGSRLKGALGGRKPAMAACRRAWANDSRRAAKTPARPTAGEPAAPCSRRQPSVSRPSVPAASTVWRNLRSTRRAAWSWSRAAAATASSPSTAAAMRRCSAIGGTRRNVPSRNSSSCRLRRLVVWFWKSQTSPLRYRSRSARWTKAGSRAEWMRRRRQKLAQINGSRGSWESAASSISRVRPTGCSGPPPEISITTSPGRSSRAARSEGRMKRRAALLARFRSQSRNSVPRTTRTGTSPSPASSSPHSPPILWTTTSASEISVQPSGRTLPSRARFGSDHSSKIVNSASPHDVRPFRRRIVSEDVADAFQTADRRLQPRGGLLDQILGIGEIVVVERLVAQPFEAVDLEIARADLVEGERPPAVFHRIAGGAAGLAVRIGAVAGLERAEMLGHERPVLLGDPRHVGARIVDPDVLGGPPLGEEDHVRLGPGAVGGEGAVGQAEHRVQVAVLGENLEHVARLVGEQAVVRHHHGGPAARLQDGQHVLQEVELLVRGDDRDVRPLRHLLGSLVAERRIGQHHVEAPVAGRLVDRVAENDLGLEAMEIEIHQSEPPRPAHQLLAEVRATPHVRRQLGRDLPLALFQQPFIGAHQKSSGSTSRIAHRELGVDPRVRLHAMDDGLDEEARREVLPGPLLPLVGRLLQQALEHRRLDVHVQRRPDRLADHLDEPLQVVRAVESRAGFLEDVTQETRLLSQRAEHRLVVLDEVRTRTARQLGPRAVDHPLAALRHGDADVAEIDPPLIRHLEEEQRGDLLDDVAVVDPVVAQGMTEAPEVLDQIAHDFRAPREPGGEPGPSGISTCG